MTDDGWVTPDDLASAPTVPLPAREEGGFVVVTAADFAAVDEPGADALLGVEDDVLIPAGGDVMVYGDGGVGKTTLCIDLACHLAAGDPWLGVDVPRPLRVLLIENEGPRSLYRRKLARKLAGWQGSTIPADGIRVVEQPWAELSLSDEDHRATLAMEVVVSSIDVVIAGPLVRLGMDAAGTLQEVRDFAALVADIRQRASRPIAFLLIHHESKIGRVSGAWEGAGDTLLHVQGSGHGKTRLYVQKARWSSTWHSKTLHLIWTDGDGFTVEDTPTLDDEELGALIVAACQQNPGASWRAIGETLREREDARGKDDRIRKIRNDLLARGLIVNVVDGAATAAQPQPGKRSRFYAASDPVVDNFRNGGGLQLGLQLVDAGSEGADIPPQPAARPKGLRAGGLQTTTPRRIAESDEDW